MMAQFYEQYIQFELKFPTIIMLLLGNDSSIRFHSSIKQYDYSI